MPPSGSEQKSPEEQDRQDDGNRDDDDLYKAHGLILKLAGCQRLSLARAVFYRCIARSVNVSGKNGLPHARFCLESKTLDEQQAENVPSFVKKSGGFGIRDG